MLLRVRSLTTGEKDEIRERLAPAGGDVPEVMQRTSRLLRELSHLTVVVQAPRPDSDVVQHLEFVQLREGQLLAVIAGGERPDPEQAGPDRLPARRRAISTASTTTSTSLVSGLTLDQARARLVEEIESERAAHDELVARALQLASAAVPADARRPRCWSTASRTCWPGKADLERAKLLLRTLEEKDLLVRLLERTLSAPGHLRVHRRRGEPGRPDRRLGGGGALRAGRAGRSGRSASSGRRA